MNKFTNYLKDLHAKQYTGTDDEMPEAFDKWLEQFDVNDIIKLGDKHAKLQNDLCESKLNK